MKIICIILVLCINLLADTVKPMNIYRIDAEAINYSGERVSAMYVQRWCVDGYVWLHTGGYNGSFSQFIVNEYSTTLGRKVAVALECPVINER